MMRPSRQFFCLCLLLATGLPSLANHAIGFRPQVIKEDNGTGVCSSSVKFREAMEGRIRETLRTSGLPKVLTKEGDFPCSGPAWTRVVFLNMSDPTHQCPGAWQEYNYPKRTCGRADLTTNGYCTSFFVETNGVQYSRVCGRLVGYPNGTPDAFAHNINNPNHTEGSLDGHYVDGLSITYGFPPPRTHIWTLAAGRNDGEEFSDCPCQGPNTAARSPEYVGQNYFCESGSWSDPLWDGEGCETDWCCSFNDPPWFSVTLATPTQERIEVRNCGSNTRRREDTLVEVMELYIQ